MRYFLYILLIIVIMFCWIATLSSFHQEARLQQNIEQRKNLEEFSYMMKLAKDNPQKLDDYMVEKYGEVDYCICVPWSEKMIKKMGRDVYHGTKRVYKSAGGI